MTTTERRPVTMLTDEQAEEIGRKVESWLWKLYQDRRQLMRALGPDVRLEIVLPEKWAPEGWVGEIGKCFGVPCFVGEVFTPVCRPKAHDYRLGSRRNWFYFEGDFVTPEGGTHVGRVEWREATVTTDGYLREALDTFEKLVKSGDIQIRIPEQGSYQFPVATAGDHEGGGAIDVTEAVAPFAQALHDRILERRSKALNRVAEQNDVLRAALMAVLEVAEVGGGPVDPTAIHDAIGGELIADLLAPGVHPCQERLDL